MSGAEERQRILDLLDNGTISAEQAIQLLATISDAQVEHLQAGVLEPEPPTPVSPVEPVEAEVVEVEPVPAVQAEPLIDEPPPVPEDLPYEDPEETAGTAPAGFDPGQLRWQNWWQWPLWIGVSVTVVSAVLMYMAYQAGGLGFWFACTWFPFLLGVLTLAFAWTSRTARWMHIRIQQKPGERPERIAISLPIPLRLTAWFLRTFRPHMPGMKNANAADLVLSLENVSPETPFYVKVDEGDDGEKVEVYIG